MSQPLIHRCGDSAEVVREQEKGDTKISAKNGGLCDRDRENSPDVSNETTSSHSEKSEWGQFVDWIKLLPCDCCLSYSYYPDL